MAIQIFTLLFALVATALARPNGAPACLLNEQAVTAGMGPPTNLNMKLEVVGNGASYTAGQAMKFRLTGANSYKGILLYAESKAAKNVERLGVWGVGNGLRSNDGTCAAKSIKAAPNSIITHDSPADKPTAQDFMWTPDRNVGDIVIRGVVATGPKSWQVLNEINLSGQGTYSTPCTKSQTPTPTPPSARKCKKWKKKSAYGTTPNYGAPGAAPGSPGYNPGAPGSAPAAPATSASSPPAPQQTPPPPEGQQAPPAAPPADGQQQNSADPNSSAESARNNSPVATLVAIAGAFVTALFF
ncbi:hypothetical protein BKA69DRAFT_1041354 [Paraphysoderma sedebokerense]|nr:hypothetical protein BKA69DRAFT_1041354 [Paraphysoderma sedebokerense]